MPGSTSSDQDMKPLASGVRWYRASGRNWATVASRLASSLTKPRGGRNQAKRSPFGSSRLETMGRTAQ